MIVNPNPNISAGSMRREVEYWRGEHAVPEHEFLVMVDPGENPLVTLLQVARLHQAHPFQGCDVTLGDVPDDSTRYMALVKSRVVTGTPAENISAADQLVHECHGILKDLPLHRGIERLRQGVIRTGTD